MSSVVQRIKEVKQLRGGYINPKQFNYFELSSTEKLNEHENISASTIGLVIDYLFRIQQGELPQDAFRISLLGAKRAGQEKIAENFLSKINNKFDNECIIFACKLTAFDMAYRADINPTMSQIYVQPDENTINNIRIMLKRCQNFVNIYGEIKSDLTFEEGYTRTVHAGDGDFMTNNIIWDMKVSTKKLSSAHTLQIYMYYLLAKESCKNGAHPEYQSLQKLGIFNPRLNCVYILDTKDIPDEIEYAVKRNVLGYNLP